MPKAHGSAHPSGAVTFLFTDIEGSTRLIQQVGTSYTEILDEHHHLIRAAIGLGEGIEVKTEGDSFFVVFGDPVHAVAAAVAAQRNLQAHGWPDGAAVRVRMGLHSGHVEPARGEYVGLDVHRAARIAAAAHGGQILVTQSTRDLVTDQLPDGVTLTDKGEHRLKDLDQREHLFQVAVEGLVQEFPPLRSVSERFDTLPLQQTSFVGRKPDVERIGHLLDHTRLLTLTGPGGTGKTRLAIEAAQAQSENYADGLAFVPLASITDPQLVAGTIRIALGLMEEPGRDPLDSVVDRIRASQMLLVLDNYEHLLDAAAVVADLLDRTLEPKILVTSRAPLHLAGEQQFAVSPLAVPSARADTATAISQSDAGALFIERVTSVLPDFELTASSAAAIGEICVRLDGLPLAIELAASRIRVLPPEAILSRLSQRLDLLHSGAARRVDRQRSLRATIDWSYALLKPDEQRAFRRMSIFVGGWGLADAEALMAPTEDESSDVLDILGRLVEHSLVRQEALTGEPRFGMLETLRQYGVAQLVLMHELEAVERAHAERFLGLAVELQPAFTSSVSALDEAERELDNIRAALRWAITQGEVEMALETVGALWRFWHLRGHLREGERWAKEVLAMSTSSATHGRTRALNALGGLQYWLGDYPSSRAAYEAMIGSARSTGDAASEAEASYSLGYIHGIDHDYDAARRAYRESERLARSVGDELGIANAIGGVALINLVDGRYEEARQGMDEAVPIFRARGDLWSYLNAQGIRGRALQYLGEHDDARAAALEQLEGSIELGDATLMALALHILASDAGQRGDIERGMRLEGASRALTDQLGGGPPNALILEITPEELAAQAGVSTDSASLWLSQGRLLDSKAALELARQPMTNAGKDETAPA